MATIVSESAFIQGGGHSPSDCIVYGTFRSTNNETQFTICPGNPTNAKNADGSAAMVDVRFITFQCTTAGGDSSPYPVAAKQFNDTLNRYQYFVSIETPDTEWAYKIEGINNGLAPSV